MAKHRKEDKELPRRDPLVELEKAVDKVVASRVSCPYSCGASFPSMNASYHHHINTCGEDV